MSVKRKVLLADPIMSSHSLLYYQAALASPSSEDGEFTVATMVRDENERGRLLRLANTDRRLKPLILGSLTGDFGTRWRCWQAFGRGLLRIERILRGESFDLVAYLYLDLALVYFALPIFRPALRAHFQQGVTGLVFRDNGLRPPAANTFKARLRSATDRWLLRKALACGALRKVAFLDHWCTDRARQLFGIELCNYGVDPVFYRPCDREAARTQLGLIPGEFAFLLFGTMSDRKGVADSLAILRETPLPKERIAILVAGPTSPEYRARLDQEVAATALKYKVVRHDRFIEDSDLPPYFAAADCVVCVYKEFTGSSNVLLHGALYGKPVLVSPGGAMEDAVRRHDFGEVVSLADPKGFAAAALRLTMLSQTSHRELAERARLYGQSMDARRFLAQFV